jgi:DnaK suppressor protein
MLKPRELTQLKQNLLSLLEDLRAQYQLGKSATDTVVLDQAMVGRLSRMDAMQQQKMAESSIQSTRKRLKKVQIALAKLDEGEYGYCDECGETIAFARLEIQPEADLCIECQSMLELSK